MNCFKAFRTKPKLEVHKKMCENHDYCYVQMSNEENKILEYKEDQRSRKAPFVIYSDLECLLEKQMMLMRINTESLLIITLLVDIQFILNVHLIILKTN